MALSIRHPFKKQTQRVYELGDTVHWISNRNLFWGKIIAWYDYPDGERKALVAAQWFNEYCGVYGGTRLVTEGEVIPPGLFKELVQNVV